MTTRDMDVFRRAYTAFVKPGRILLTGHSHQAWPDAARDAQARYFDDAATYVDDKWEKVVFPKMDAVGRRILLRMGLPETDAITFGKSTHELVFRLLSAFGFNDRTRVVTTSSEFHSLHRQLTRLSEEGVRVEFVDAQPRAALVDRLLAAVTPGTTLLALSAVLFEDAYVVPRLPELLKRAAQVGAQVLLDGYHAFNVVPLHYGEHLDHVFVTAGGYKYAQFGEGLCWLRIPRHCTLRPVYTGWFADFDAVARPRAPHVGYGDGGTRFNGATFDASAVYRAEAVLDHWDHFGFSLHALRELSLQQTRAILELFKRHGVTGVVTPEEDTFRGGFVSVQVPNAGAVVEALRKKNVWVDARGTLLRVGPSPILSPGELELGVNTVAQAIQESRS